MKTDYWVRVSVFGVEADPIRDTFMPASRFKYRRELKIRVDQLTYGYKWVDQHGYVVDDLKEELIAFTAKHPKAHCLFSYCSDNYWGYHRGFVRIQKGAVVEEKADQRPRGSDDDALEKVIDEWVFAYHDNHNRDVSKYKPRLSKAGRGGLVFTRYQGQRVFLYKQGVDNRLILKATKIHENMTPTLLGVDILSSQRLDFKMSEKGPVIHTQANRPHSLECRAGDTVYIKWLGSWVQVHIMEVFPKRPYLDDYQSIPHTRLRVEADIDVSIDREEVYRKKHAKALSTNNV